MLKRKSKILFVCLLAWSFLSLGSVAHCQQANKDVMGALRYRYIGPVGNRLTSVAGVPSQPNIYYVGAASGGIWKTVDGGTHWEPIFDDQVVSSIGALAIAPSDPNVVWAGTGEPWIRSHISVGQGIYRSNDAGKTWNLMGLEKTGRIARIFIDPHNPNTVLVAAIGHAYGPQPDRGVFRTTDGGKTWDKVLFVDEKTGCSDLAMDPNNPRIVFAGMWPLEIHTWGRESGGPGSGLYKSTDGGATWTKLSGHGLPTRTTGKFALAIARSNSNRIYALIETGDGVPLNGQETDRGKLWRSDDGGDNWRLVSYDRSLGGRTHYYFRMAVAPDNENETYYLTSGFAVSLDGGETTRAGGGFAGSPGGDNHDMWIDPGNANRMAVANDGGVSISVTRGKTWNRIQLPIAQMYHVTVDNRVPYFVYGNEQDDPSYRGPSRVPGGGFGGGQIPRSAWQSVAGGESGWATPDPEDPNIVWSSASGSGSIGGIVERYDLRNGQARNVEVWPDQINGTAAAELKYRFVWTMPLAISPHDHNKIYVGSQYVHQTTDGGQSWQVISPDLTTNDKTKQGFSGGLTGDNIGVEYAPVIFAISESRIESGVIWAGTNDGQVQVTRDGGKNWSNVTKNISGLPPWGTVSNIEPSRYNAGSAYLTVDFHQVNNRDPFIYKTKDYGKTWKAITSGIPHSMLSYAHCVREDPVRQGLLYVGTENGLYISFEDGEKWEPLQANLPHAPVYWMIVQEHFNDLVIATYGRGFWILDDLTPLQQMTDSVRAANAHLFMPHATYRFRSGTVPVTMSDDPTAGQNPPYGAAISYYLKAAPSGDVKIRIEDAKGQTVRTINGTKNAGLNRVTWDLRGEPSKEMRLRTSPAYAPELRVGTDGTRSAPDGARLSLLLPPGGYKVTLSAGGPELSQPLIVKKDPSSTGSEADIQAQMEMLVDLRKDLESATEMVNQIEDIRAQLNTLTGMLTDASLRKSADDLDKKFIDVEDNLIQRKLTGQGQDSVRWPSKLVSKISYLASGLSGSDFGPTAQQREVQTLLKGQLATQRARLEGIVSGDLAAFNKQLRDRNIGNIVTQ
ncbi:MAG: glycosyl hydrolase, repeat-containing protein [Acidobacteria bacterium]|nr:glycosyl hydrolase, repeat-containing protein [Acidobacteriota bacterium]